MSYSKLSNALPPIGGMTGALFEVFPNFHSIMTTIILAAVGAIVGYFMKIALDKLMQFIKK